MNTNHSRFSSAPWYSEDALLVLVGGAGGIGSWLTVLLARAGFKPYVVDHDVLEETNLAGQLYGKEYIGFAKVVALANMVEQLTGMQIHSDEAKIDFGSSTEKYCFSCFDNMLARKAMFHNWRSAFGSDHEAIFIDGRLAAEHMQVFCIRGGDIDNQDAYIEKHLFSDDDKDVDNITCTLKQTSHSAAMIAANMVGFFTNHITNVRQMNQGRVVPAYWDYFTPVVLSDVLMTLDDEAPIDEASPAPQEESQPDSVSA